MDVFAVRSGRRGVFVEGLVSGVIGTLALGGMLLYALQRGHLPADGAAEGMLAGAAPALNWASANLGLSLPVFAAIALLFVHSLVTLRARVQGNESLARVAQAEHLVDTWTALFLGVGVIWTAIGMRGALLFALGDPASVQADGAFALLQRMVDGGILLALSTTIFGGAGGYLMRVVKTLTVGVALRRYYELAAGRPARANTELLNQTLLRIEARLDTLARSGAAPSARDD